MNSAPPEPRSTPRRRVGHAVLVLGYLGSVAVSVAIYILARRLLSGGLGLVIGAVSAVALVPVSPALCLLLQGRLPLRASALAAAYASELASLVLELAFLLLILPLVAASLLRIMLWLPLLALTIGLVLCLLQEVLRLPLGVNVSHAEAIIYAAALLVLLVLEAIIRLTKDAAHRLEERYTRSLHRMRARLERKLARMLGPYLESDH